MFVRSLLSVTFVEFTSKFLVKVSLSEYISLTTNQKAFIFEPWVPERVSFYTMGFYTPGIYAAGYIVFALTFVRSSVRMFVR